MKLSQKYFIFSINDITFIQWHGEKVGHLKPKFNEYRLKIWDKEWIIEKKLIKNERLFKFENKYYQILEKKLIIWPEKHVTFLIKKINRNYYILDNHQKKLSKMVPFNGMNRIEFSEIISNFNLILFLNLYFFINN
ncbi:MAG: hypothetical protein EAX96_10550 [Candidatus Lokiarchaeota archaeon]|nr:hypothetical protein [Candidatus Lokiarchaeota archaeon]